jgi:hypothetical protein
LDNQQSTIDYLLEEEKSVDEPHTESINFLEGICPNCLDSGFVHTVKDGILGMAYRFEGEDSLGRPIKRLQVCSHGIKHKF